MVAADSACPPLAVCRGQQLQVLAQHFLAITGLCRSKGRKMFHVRISLGRGMPCRSADHQPDQQHSACILVYGGHSITGDRLVA